MTSLSRLWSILERTWRKWLLTQLGAKRCRWPQRISRHRSNRTAAQTWTWWTADCVCETIPFTMPAPGKLSACSVASCKNLFHWSGLPRRVLIPLGVASYSRTFSRGRFAVPSVQTPGQNFYWPRHAGAVTVLTTERVTLRSPASRLF